MRFLFSTTLMFWCIFSDAQAPPVIQWQKCLGGTFSEIDLGDMEFTIDGGIIICGTTNSNDGDVTGTHNGSQDVWVVKTDLTGNIQWQRSFGGSNIDMGFKILQTSDGGYIFFGQTSSNDGDVTGNHGAEDIWLVKLDVLGNIQWQKCYGGTRRELASTMYPTLDGGYIIGGTTNSIDGDVVGYHTSTAIGIPPADAWILKIDALGNLLWQKCIGGTEGEHSPKIIQSLEGGYFCALGSWSSDGDVDCPETGRGRFIMMKLDDAGNIQWRSCWGTWDVQSFQGIRDIQQAQDGNYFITGQVNPYLNTPTYGGNDIFLIKLSSAGNIQWTQKYGGSSMDFSSKMILLYDGGIILTGSTISTNYDICNNFGNVDFWVIKLYSTGIIEWQKTYGGSSYDWLSDIHVMPDGGFIVCGITGSDDRDVSGNHGDSDWWLVKLSFPGIPVIPAVSISADKISICPGQAVTFIATPIDGGAAPSYQWQVNGVNTGADNDTIIINTLNDGDSVSCILTSNARCLTSQVAVSNKIAITIENSRGPSGFLPADTTMCLFDEFELKPQGSYSEYLWNTSAISNTLIVTTPGLYWLQVATNEGCSGRDSIIVTSKECLKGFYMPTGFTPNGDGRNDVLKPFIGGRILQYKLTIINRWGQVIFQTSEPGKGWDGTYKGKKQNNDVFVWTCRYQFAGEEMKLERGTAVIIR